MDPEEQAAIFKQKYLAKGVGDAATKDYIARKYLSSSAEGSRKKRKKLKAVVQKGNLGIVDEDDAGWKASAPTGVDEEKRWQREQQRLSAQDSTNSNKNIERLSEESGNGWQLIQSDQDEEPVIVSLPGEPETPTVQPKMSSGQKAGLLTSEDLKHEAAKARAAEQRMIKKLKEEDSGRHATTIRRDETGRAIDPKIRKAKEAQARKDAIAREEQRMEWGKGLVQRNETKEKRRQLDEEKDKPLARYANDVEYNEGLKETQRWNDPAAGFLTQRSQSARGLVRPTYKGPWKPNRFMIRPGYRWDGVDRSNGFEDQFLLNQNQKQARAVEAHAWSTEDM